MRPLSCSGKSCTLCMVYAIIVLGSGVDYGFLGSVVDHDLSMRVNMMKIKSYNYESILSLLVSRNNRIPHFYLCYHQYTLISA